MSTILASNILPTRTRSGRSCPQTPAREPVISVAPMAPVKKRRARVNTQALDVLCRAALYVNLLDESKELYRRQVEYVQDVKREKKFELMAAYQNLTRKVSEFIVFHSTNSTLHEIENMSELVGWISRMSVFHQVVCVA